MLARSFDAAVARALQDSPRAAQLCAELAGRQLAIRIDGAAAELRVRSSGNALSLDWLAGERATQADAADASVGGAPLSLLRFVIEEAPGPLRALVRIEGDARVAERFGELARLLRPDIEDALARRIGPGGAHLLARAARAGLQWARTASHSALQGLADYLAHERGDLVPRLEGEQYQREAEQLRERLDRLEAQLLSLEQRAERLGGPGAAR